MTGVIAAVPIVSARAGPAGVVSRPAPPPHATCDITDAANTAATSGIAARRRCVPPWTVT
ncbi:MAG: hypothetical protein R2752_02795 [Vicinamibacterales bacterium]